MPYVQVRVSVPMNKEQIEKLAAEALNSISLIPEKSAPVTMAEVIPDCNLYYGSTDGAPCAIVDVACNNTPDPAALKEYSINICKALNAIAGIDLQRIYVKHHGIPEWHASKNLFAE